MRSVFAIAILCAAVCAPAPASAVDFTFTANTQVKIDTLQATVKANAYLSHSEGDSVPFVITKAQSIPLNWQASICVNGYCYSPFVTEVPEEAARFAPGRIDTVAIWFQGLVEGTGYATITVAPVGEPERAVPITFSLVTEGVDLLIVDDDGGADYDSVCAASLPEPMIAGTWRRSLEAPTAEDLAKFSRVVWLTGEASPSLDAADRAAISGYLTGGGEMLLSGQNIAYSLCDPASAEYSEEARDWLRDTFHVTYGQDDVASSSVSGVEGDPIGNALAFAIDGGTGAGNQTSADAVFAADNGVECFVYGIGEGAGRAQPFPAGVRNATNCPTTVFLGFGFEGIAEAADREALLDRVLGYMDSAAPNPDSCRTAVTPVSNTMLSLSRNPFSPSGESPTMEFVIRLAPPAQARLEIFDIAGRLVRTLHDGEVAAPQTSVPWDGSDDDNEPVASGVYFARLTADTGTETQRTVLLK